MKHSEFIQRAIAAVNQYLGYTDSFDSDPQLQVNPATLSVVPVRGIDMHNALADSYEAIEDAAAAEGDANESATDFQVKRNPDFYPIRKLLKKLPDGRRVPDEEAIAAIAANYPE